MLLADWIAIGVIALFCLIGIIVGFARGLKFFTSGFFGFIILIIVCYMLGGPIYQIAFIQELLAKLNGALANKNTFCDILITIRIDLIVFYVALFIILIIMRVIIVKIVVALAETENGFIKFIDRILGTVFFTAVLLLIVLLAFWVVDLIGGGTEEVVLSYITGSKLKLDWFYDNNPLMIIINIIRLEIQV